MMRRLFCLIGALFALQAGPARGGAWTVPEGRTHIIAGLELQPRHHGVRLSTPASPCRSTSRNCSVPSGSSMGCATATRCSPCRNMRGRTSRCPRACRRNPTTFRWRPVFGRGCGMRRAYSPSRRPTSARARSACRWQARRTIPPGNSNCACSTAAASVSCAATGFADLEIAQRRIAGAPARRNRHRLHGRPGCGAAHAIALSKLQHHRGGRCAPALHLLPHPQAADTVSRLSKRWSLQSAFFYSPTGQNALVEQGFSLSLWTTF